MRGGNPFYVNPLGNADPGRGFMRGLAIRDNRDARSAREAQAAKEAAAKQKQEQGLLAAQDAISRGDTAELQRIMLHHPDIAEQVRATATWGTEQGEAEYGRDYGGISAALRQNDLPAAVAGMQERLKRLKANGDPNTASTEADLAMLQDPTIPLETKLGKINTELVLSGNTELLQNIDSRYARPAAQSPTGKLIADRDAAIKAGAGPEVIAAYDRELDKADGSYSQGTGDMAGWTFNNKTGTWSMDPAVRESMQATEAMASAGETLSSKDIVGVNNNVTALIKQPNEIYNAYTALEALQESGSPVAQTGAVFKIMKAFDPNSSVRESEQGQIYSASGPAAALAAKLNQAVGEGGLTDATFRDIVDTAKVLAKSAVGDAQGEIDRYLNVIEDVVPPKQMRSMRDRLPKFDEGDDAGEGAIAVNDKGDKLIKRNGVWVPFNG